MITGDHATIEGVCACYGLTDQPGASMTAVSRGAVGRIWRLELGDRRYAVKELFLDAGEAAVQQEAALTAQLESAGIGLPGSVRGRDGRFLAWLAGTDGDGGWVRLYRWIDGVPADLADPGTATGVGDLLGRLHAGAAPAVDDGERWYDTVPDPAVWAPLAADGRAHGEGWGPVLAQHTGLLAELTTLVTPQDPGQLVSCHRDLHPENVLVDGSGAIILLDWDDAGPACPDRELARLLTDWHVHDGVPDGAAVRRTMAAYLAAGGPGRIRDELSFGMVIACTLNFLHRQAIVTLDASAPAEHREYAAAETAETLTRLPTRRLLAQLVSLATAVTG
ncbi:MAG: phosphotransferase [Actinomycetota bacterium]